MYKKDNVSTILKLAKEAIIEKGSEYEESVKWKEALSVLSEKTEHPGLLTFHFYWEEDSSISVMIGEKLPQNYGELIKFHPRIKELK